jgi:hypothetical protein
VYSHLSNKREVTLTDFEKFHPPQNCFFVKNYRKNNCLNYSLAVEATCFTKHLSYLNSKGEAYSCNIPTSMFFDFATFAPPPTLARTKLLCMKNAGTQWTMNFS